MPQSRATLLWSSGVLSTRSQPPRTLLPFTVKVAGGVFNLIAVAVVVVAFVVVFVVVVIVLVIVVLVVVVGPALGVHDSFVRAGSG